MITNSILIGEEYLSNNWVCEYNKKDKNIKLKAAENQKIYFPVGKYRVTISKEKTSENQSFQILTSKK